MYAEDIHSWFGIVFVVLTNVDTICAALSMLGLSKTN